MPGRRTEQLAGRILPSHQCSARYFLWSVVPLNLLNGVIPSGKRRVYLSALISHSQTGVPPCYLPPFSYLDLLRQSMILVTVTSFFNVFQYFGLYTPQPQFILCSSSPVCSVQHDLLGFLILNRSSCLSKTLGRISLALCSEPLSTFCLFCLGFLT